MLKGQPEQPLSSIHAAGGLVWLLGGETLLAVVHRPKHGDWTLPKGKLNENESAREGARREAEEETGCRVSLQEYVGSISYLADGRPKIVQFWHMESDGQPIASLESDVDQVKWLPPAEALQILSHPLERLLVKTADRLCSPLIDPSLRPSPWKRFFDTSEARLYQSITSHEPESLRLIYGARTTERSFADAAIALLARAGRAIRERDTETGWLCFKAARRMELFLLSPEERRTKVSRLTAEAEQKLSSWRKSAVQSLILENGSVAKDPPAHVVAEVALLINEYEDNTYKLLRMRRRQFSILGLCAMVFALLMAVFPLDPTSPLNILSPSSLFYFATLGALGACVSGILRIGQAGREVRVPDELGAFPVLVARLGVGAIAAIVLTVALQVGVFSVAKLEPSVQLAVLVAFAAGFSERLAQNAVERLAS